GGASRPPTEEIQPEPPASGRKGFARRRLPIVLLVLAAVATWKYAPQIRERFLGSPAVGTEATLPSPVTPQTPTEPAQAPTTPTPIPPAGPPVAAPDASSQKALSEQATRAATEARAMFERAEEAARAARALAGEARIVAARAARPD